MSSKAHFVARESGGPSARPLVVVNMAMTADGKTATANRSVASFGSPRDLAHLYALRATADAVMCGARTAEMDGLQLGPGPARYRRLRRQHGLAEYNLRVLVSGTGSINPRAPIFTRRFSPILILTTERAATRRLAALRKVADEVLVVGERQVDFAAALAEVRARWGVRRLVCEGGGELNAALFSAGLVDELHLTICPFVFGGRDAPSIADGSGVTKLTEAARLELRSCRRHGEELFCMFAAAGRGGAA